MREKNVGNNQQIISAPNAMEAKIRETCTMHDQDYSSQRFGHLQTALTQSHEKPLLPLVLPHVQDHRRVIYSIFEYEPLLDSSNMQMEDWIHIAEDIQDAYELFDGFVILHGTDTLAYTASALSFMLENLGIYVLFYNIYSTTFFSGFLYLPNIIF